MRRVAGLMAMIAALTGTPLRQAEAAADFCRSIIESPQPASIEIPDGGVGDDSGVGNLPGLSAFSAADLLGPVAPLFLPPIAARSPASTLEALREVLRLPPLPPNLRHAWLQIFLF